MFPRGVCIERVCVQRCGVFTSGLYTRVMCEGVSEGCVRECV